MPNQPYNDNVHQQFEETPDTRFSLDPMTINLSEYYASCTQVTRSLIGFGF